MDENDIIPDFFEERDILGQPKVRPATITNFKHQFKYNTYENISMPFLAQRVKAVIIDSCIIISLTILFSLFFNLFGSVHISFRIILFILLFYLYEPILVSRYSGTIGHKIIGIKVKLYKDSNKNIGFFRAFFRFYLKTILGWISFFTITFNKNHRSIHDIASGAIVLFKSTNAVQPLTSG